MLGAERVIAFVGATDLDRALAFYGGVLGLTAIERNDFAVAFDAHGTMLRVTAVQQVPGGGPTVLGWHVTDLDATIAGLTAQGVEFLLFEGMAQDRLGVWTTPDGDRVAWFADPDGNTLSLTQFD